MNKSGFERLRALGKERVLEIERRFHKGDSALSIARMIKNEWGEYEDVSEATLGKQLSRYKNEHINASLVAAIQQAEGNETAARKALHRRESFDALDALQDVIQLQKGRIEKAMNQEGGMSFLMSGNNKEIKLLKDAIESWAKIALEVGVMKRATKEVRAQLTYGNDDYDLQLQISEHAELQDALDQIGSDWKDYIDGEVISNK